MKGGPVVLIVFFLLFTSFINRQPALADCRFFSELIHNGGYAVADREGKIVSACNQTTPFIPASIIKIPLALAAFELLGPDFRFITEFYNDNQGNLYIRGHGDPFLISEEIDLILHRLVAKGVREINAIYIDDSLYDLEKQAPGRGRSDNPYDVPVSPVAVNFNTVNIQVKKDGQFVSAEEQTPTLPIMGELGRGLAPGIYRLNVCQGDCPPAMQSARYAGELFRSLQQENGIPGKGPIERKLVPREAELIYTHENSRNLEQVVYSFLEFSNNFIANQLFLQCGLHEFGLPATWNKARKAVAETLEKVIGKDIAQQLYLEEGSGLSRKNRTTASAMLKVLDGFRPYSNLLQEKKNASVKSGTLQGVYNFAGYLPDGRAFVILLNQEENTRDAILAKLFQLH